MLGAALGSFAGAQVWRLRAQQLVEDQARGEPVDKAELRRLQPLLATLRQDRSRCLHCAHRLRWYDLLPVISWLSLAGKCRYCRRPIGWTELLLELGVAALFVLSIYLWPSPLVTGLEIARLVLWLAALVCLVILFVYDLRWYLLPDILNLPFIGLAMSYALLTLLGAADVAAALLSLSGAIAILSGLYLALYIISKGEWVGFGDVKLGLGLAGLLGNWQLAFIALFLANFIGTLLVLPGMLRGKVARGAKVPFGPLLIAGMLLAWWSGAWLIEQLLFVP